MKNNDELISELMQAAWSLCRNVHIVKSTGAVPGSLRERVGELRRVLERIEDERTVHCGLCNGHGHFVIVGSAAQGSACPRCGGSGVQK